jgi:hypothetical protein
MSTARPADLVVRYLLVRRQANFDFLGDRVDALDPPHGVFCRKFLAIARQGDDASMDADADMIGTALTLGSYSVRPAAADAR